MFYNVLTHPFIVSHPISKYLIRVNYKERKKEKKKERDSLPLLQHLTNSPKSYFLNEYSSLKDHV